MDKTVQMYRKDIVGSSPMGQTVQMYRYDTFNKEVTARWVKPFRCIDRIDANSRY